uniref:AJLec n=1 Tax=Anthopleura japonica TaxID=67755 RepID=UPI0015ECD80D
QRCGGWVKLNTAPVCFSAKGNRPGSFTPSHHGFLKSVKLRHLRGLVTCQSSTDAHDSYWGCKNRNGFHNYPLNVFVTDKHNKVMFPKTGATYYLDPYVIKNRFYGVQGYNAMSPELVLQHGCNSPSDYIGPDSQLRVWYGEDLYNTMESDNSGKVCADVFGYFV